MELIEPYMNLIYLGGIILALLIFAWIMIKTFGGRMRAKRGARLGISEYYEVDKSRFLVLVRRDDVEHLVLIGGTQDVVIEQGIGGKSSRKGTIDPATEQAMIRPDVAREPTAPSSPRTIPLSNEPELPVDDSTSNIRPMSPRPAPRPPVFGEPAPVERAPNLRAVERDPD